MKSLVLVLSLLVFAANTAKAQVAPYTNVTPTLKALNAAPLNGSTASLTITKRLYRNGVQQPAFAKGRLIINYTHVAATALTVTFACSIDGIAFGQLTTRSISGGTSTVSALTDSLPAAASSIMLLDYDVRGCLAAQWVFAATGAGSTDTVSVDVTTLTGI